MRDLAGIIQENQDAALRHHSLAIAEALCDCVAEHNGTLRENFGYEIANLLGKVAGALPEGNPKRVAAESLRSLVFDGGLPSAPVRSNYVPTSVYTPLEAVGAN